MSENNVKHWQKMLIPVNIVTMILAFVAAITLVFAPLLTVDLNGIGDKVKAAQKEMNITVSDDMQDALDMLSGLDGKLSLSVFDLAEYTFAEDKTTYLAEKTADVVDEVGDKVFIGAAVKMAVKNAESEYNVDLSGVDADKIEEKLEKLENAKPEDVDAAINECAEEVRAQLGDEIITQNVFDELVKYIRKLYDDSVQYTEDGKFDLETAICVAISKIINGDNDNGENANEIPVNAASVKYKLADGSPSADTNGAKGDGKIYTNYNDLFTAMFKGEAVGVTGGSALDKYTDMVDPYMVYVVCGLSVFAVLWAILFLFAFFHLFMKNKRFTMWYVKLWGASPCLTFFITPLLASWILGSFLNLPAMAALVGVVSSFTWISGLCYLLLWIVSIFWAYPIKRKIRAAKREAD